MGFRALKLLSEGFGGVKPCNHQYRGCHLKNPTDINDYGSYGTLGAFFSVCRGNYPGKEKRGEMSKNWPDVAEF